MGNRLPSFHSLSKVSRVNWGREGEKEREGERERGERESGVDLQPSTREFNP